MFDGISYFKAMALRNKACAGYTVTECSGPMGVEGMMYSFRKSDSFVMVDDTTVGSVAVNRAGGAFDRRTYTVFLIRQHTADDMADYEEKMQELRSIYRQLLSRMLRDRAGLALEDVYLQTGNVTYKEPGPMGFNGSASIYFMVSIDEPLDLTYDEEQWSD